MNMNITNNRGGFAVAETKTLPPRPHFDGGCFQGSLEEACLTKITKEHMVNLINDCIRMSTEDDGGGAEPMRIWEVRCYAMIRRIVTEAESQCL